MMQDTEGVAGAWPRGLEMGPDAHHVGISRSGRVQQEQTRVLGTKSRAKGSCYSFWHSHLLSQSIHSSLSQVTVLCLLLAPRTISRLP